jgi:hypothetical protein
VPRVEEDLLAEPDADPRDGFRRSEGAFPPSSTGERRRSGGGGDPRDGFRRSDGAFPLSSTGATVSGGGTDWRMGQEDSGNVLTRIHVRRFDL